MGLDDEIGESFAKKLLYLLKPIFGEGVERLLELGIWWFLLKFYFGLHWKNLVAILIIIILLSIFKKYFYREDWYLAFAILMLFQESPILGNLLFIYLSYFRGLCGLINPEMR